MDNSGVDAQVTGVVLSMVIAVLRVVYDREETKPLRILLEALFCGALTMTVYYGTVALKLDANWAVFAGGTIGYFGSTVVKSIAFRYLQNKTK